MILVDCAAFQIVMGIRTLAVAGTIYMLIIQVICDFGFSF